MSSDEESEVEVNASHLEDQMRRELEELEQEEQQTIKAISSSRSEEVQKATQVRHQRAIWDNCVEIRIKLQGLLSIGNQLPSADSFSSQDGIVLAKLASIANGLSETVNELLDLRSVLAKQLPELPPVSVPSRKRVRDECDSLWSEIQAADEATRPYCDEAMEKWYRRTQTTAATSKSLKAFNQGILEQIQSALSNRERMAKRISDSDKYDDSEYYQQLLRELIESANLDGTDPLVMGQQWFAMQKLKGQKIRKEVDRRASKGRRIRYNVHEKLVNFMAPTNLEEDLSVDLFQHLFQKA